MPDRSFKPESALLQDAVRACVFHIRISLKPVHPRFGKDEINHPFHRFRADPMIPFFRIDPGFLILIDEGDDIENMFDEFTPYIIYVSVKNVTIPKEFDSKGSGIIYKEIRKGYGYAMDDR